MPYLLALHSCLTEMPMKTPGPLGRAKITSKCQITLPAELRDYFRFKPGDEIEFFTGEDGYVRVQRHVDRAKFNEMLDRWSEYFYKVNPEWAGKTTDEIMEELRGPVEPGDL